MIEAMARHILCCGVDLDDETEIIMCLLAARYRAHEISYFLDRLMARAKQIAMFESCALARTMERRS